jgi:hypothetical protein
MEVIVSYCIMEVFTFQNLEGHQELNEIPESKGSHDAIRHGQRYEDHVGEETGAQFPRLPQQCAAPTGRDIFRFL